VHMPGRQDGQRMCSGCVVRDIIAGVFNTNKAVLSVGLKAVRK
jgi:hypothetical protein